MDTKFLDIYTSIFNLQQDMDQRRRPTGTKDYPVRTCRDLFYGHSNFKDGKTTIINF